jgi:tetratricopeptide (TPR) repeat protein
VLSAFLAACGPDLQALLEQAETSWRKGRYNEAILANEELLKREPRGKYAAHALLSIANIQYLNLRQIKPAINFYTRLNREFPETPDSLQAHRHLAEIYENEVIDLDQAITQLSALLEARDLKDRFDILYRRADLFFKKENYDRALRELRSLQDAGAQGRLADQVLLKVGSIYQIQKKYDLAIEPFTRALASEFPEIRRRALLSLAENYENLFDFDNAVATMRKMPRTPEDEAFVASEIARLNKKRRDVEKGGTLIGITESAPASTRPVRKK